MHLLLTTGADIPSATNGGAVVFAFTVAIILATRKGWTR